MSQMIPYIFILCDAKTDPMMETLNYFQKQMSQAVSDPVFITFSPGNAFIDAVKAIDHRIDSNTTVVMLNNRGFTASLDGKTLYWAEKNVRLINILVDHPFYYTDMLLMAPPNMKLGLVDRHFVSLMNKWLPSIGKNAFFLPHGGVDLGLSRVPFSKRPVDVLYIGSRYSDDVFYPPLEHLPGNGSEFYEFAADMYFSNDYIEEDGIVERYLEAASIEATIPQKILMTVSLLKSVKFSAMHVMKTELITALISSGLHVTIHGKGWESLKEKYPDKVTIGGWLDSEGCIREMANAKITLNMMPFFRDGDHERIYNSMLSGSVVVSNRSRYLEGKFREGNDIMYMDDDPGKTAEAIKGLLNDPEKWLDMSLSAYSRAKECTWEKRMEEYIK